MAFQYKLFFGSPGNLGGRNFTYMMTKRSCKIMLNVTSSEEMLNSYSGMFIFASSTVLQHLHAVFEEVFKESAPLHLRKSEFTLLCSEFILLFKEEVRESALTHLRKPDFAVLRNELIPILLANFLIKVFFLLLWCSHCYKP
ncbi:hypothetical protein KFK09_010112 [Dendrobium nobile]|uniref:Uncharacterized protein n=1 Tax=Dendrobium nobile TaxID=94219 RepID=A0A8T3BLN4_DENNO|nr:hypothetical protein KFK09_010112 [Dendrobium nobile]